MRKKMVAGGTVAQAGSLRTRWSLVALAASLSLGGTACSGGERPAGPKGFFPESGAKEVTEEGSGMPSDTDVLEDPSAKGSGPQSMDSQPQNDATSGSMPGGSQEDNSDPGEETGEGPGKFDLGDFEQIPKEMPCAIDFLFVIDNSPSMIEEQVNLSRSVPEFIKTLTEDLEDLGDYHIGVTTSDAYRFGIDECGGVMGALITQTSGEDSSNQLCVPYASGSHFMIDKDDLSKSFVCAARPGTSGSGAEKPIDAMRAALTMEALGTSKCNDGFLRDEALLVVVIITDEDDDRPLLGPAGSNGDPKDWYQDLVKVKGGDAEKVVTLGLVGKPAPNECPLFSGTEHASRLISFIEMFGARGFVGDVCAPNYDPFFEKAVSVIDLACDNLPEG